MVWGLALGLGLALVGGLQFLPLLGPIPTGMQSLILAPNVGGRQRLSDVVLNLIPDALRPWLIGGGLVVFGGWIAFRATRPSASPNDR